MTARGSNIHQGGGQVCVLAKETSLPARGAPGGQGRARARASGAKAATGPRSNRARATCSQLLVLSARPPYPGRLRKRHPAPLSEGGSGRSRRRSPFSPFSLGAALEMSSELRRGTRRTLRHCYSMQEAASRLERMLERLGAGLAARCNGCNLLIAIVRAITSKQQRDGLVHRRRPPPSRTAAAAHARYRRHTTSLLMEHALHELLQRLAADGRRANDGCCTQLHDGMTRAVGPPGRRRAYRTGSTLTDCRADRRADRQGHYCAQPGPPNRPAATS